MARIEKLRFKSKREKYIKPILYIFVLMVSTFFIFCAMGQPDGTAWTWSVKSGDIQGQDKSVSTPLFYLPNDTVNISWEIKPSSNTTIKAAQMQVYPKDTDKSKIKPIPIKSPYKGYQYVPLDENMYLIKSTTEDERTYNVEINARAETSWANDSKIANETHIIEIKVMKPGTLEIQKRVTLEGTDLLGWKFTLTGPIGTNQEETLEQLTNSLGVARFPELRPGNYTIKESSKSGWLQKNPGQEEVPVIIEPGITIPMAFENAPNILKITKRDSEGHLLSGWVFVVEGTQSVQKTEPTDKSGMAMISGLPSGEYRIREVMDKDGWKQVSQSESTVIFASGEEKIVEFVNAKTGTIKITKRDSAGVPLSGWIFSIKGPDNRESGPTDASGTLIVTDLLPGEYVIQENLNSDWVNVTPIRQEVTLKPGETSSVQFINDPLVELEILKFNDINGNSKQDINASRSSNEEGLSGWTFSIEGPNGFKATAGPTDSEGMAVVRGLTPGKYTVREGLSQYLNPGWIGTTSNPQQVEISRNSPNRVEFGNKVNSITILSFDDLNLNGKRDEGEIGLSGWTQSIESPDGSKSASQPTNSDGIIALKGLVPGRYNISENLKDGWINTTPLGLSVPIAAGESKTIEFGNTRTCSIEVFKFNDTNRNGIFDLSEKGLSGWIFTVKGPNGSEILNRSTDDSGRVLVDGLSPGNYTVTEGHLDGWLSTTPASTSIFLGAGESGNLTFGNYYCVRCHRIADSSKTDRNNDSELVVIKDVSDISTENIDQNNGYIVNYNITLCPSRGLKDIAAIPTDIVIAVDNSPSINNLNRSAIAGVKNLVEGIREYDKQNVTRVGLVSWSDENHSKIEVPLTNSYDSIIKTVSEIRFAEGKKTDYQNGLDIAFEAFIVEEEIAGREKKIVFITDASDNGYKRPLNLMDARYSEYTIFAVVVGNKRETEAFKMLDGLTRKHNGYVVSVNNLSELGPILTRMATAGSSIKNVHLVEVLPSYLVLLNGTANDDKGQIHLNGDSRDWTTTTISWDIGDLSSCWSTQFQAVFCWKLPADINQPSRISRVNYTDEKGKVRSIQLPEHEINIVPTSSQIHQEASDKPEAKSLPGFGAIFAAIVLITSMRGYGKRSR